uniref:Pectin acetylesterase n=1 Tax=Aegilops tauschii subsp. strangulata TaxID=200361 RepID=A0A453GXE6_AEGTS
SLTTKGGGWCGTVNDCSNRRMSDLGSSKFMKPIQFTGAGILSSDHLQNPDFYNWNKAYVRYCDGASFSGDAEGQAEVIFLHSDIYDVVVSVASGDVLLAMV